jgi:hypothetical protein
MAENTTVKFLKKTPSCRTKQNRIGQELVNAEQLNQLKYEQHY